MPPTQQMSGTRMGKGNLSATNPGMPLSQQPPHASQPSQSSQPLSNVSIRGNGRRGWRGGHGGGRGGRGGFSGEFSKPGTIPDNNTTAAPINSPPLQEGTVFSIDRSGEFGTVRLVMKVRLTDGSYRIVTESPEMRIDPSLSPNDVVQLVRLSASQTEWRKPVAAAPIDTNKLRRPRKTLTVDSLIGEKGLCRIEELFPRIRWAGPGHEAEDIHKLIQAYKEWAFELLPRMNFQLFIKRVEKLRSKRVHMYLADRHDSFDPKRIRMQELNHSNDHNDNNNIIDAELVKIVDEEFKNEELSSPRRIEDNDDDENELFQLDYGNAEEDEDARFEREMADLGILRSNYTKTHIEDQTAKNDENSRKDATPAQNTKSDPSMVQQPDFEFDDKFFSDIAVTQVLAQGNAVLQDTEVKEDIEEKMEEVKEGAQEIKEDVEDMK